MAGPGHRPGTHHPNAMGIRILVVEDEAEIADFLLRGLREEGFTVELAVDCETTAHRLGAAEWDLLLLDRTLPDGTPASGAPVSGAELIGTRRRRTG